jgi:23S rRNA pseudouridine2605 synthase
VKTPDIVRIQKLISHYGYTSRRKSEDLIREGRVYVNGYEVKELGLKVPQNALIEIDGCIINREIPSIYLLVNKPKGYLCSKSDPLKNRKLIYELLDEKYNNWGVFSVGRLDFMSEGLILFTNDGHFANWISHPSSNILKRYEVSINRKIPYNLIAMWRDGIYIKGEKYRIVDFKKLHSNKVSITLNEGKNREIRRLFEHIHLKVVKLKRVAIGPLELDDTPVGKFRHLTSDEIMILIGKKQLKEDGYSN